MTADSLDMFTSVRVIFIFGLTSINLPGFELLYLKLSQKHWGKTCVCLYSVPCLYFEDFLGLIFFFILQQVERTMDSKTARSSLATASPEGNACPAPG